MIQERSFPSFLFICKSVTDAKRSGGGKRSLQDSNAVELAVHNGERLGMRAGWVKRFFKLIWHTLVLSPEREL